MKRHLFLVLFSAACAVFVTGCVKREKAAAEPAQIPAAAVEDAAVEAVPETAGTAADAVENTAAGAGLIDTVQKQSAMEEQVPSGIRAPSKEDDSLVRQTNAKAAELHDKLERQEAALKEQTENNEKVNALKARAQSAFDDMENTFDDF
jgi:hypothetical protein